MLRRLRPVLLVSMIVMVASDPMERLKTITGQRNTEAEASGGQRRLDTVTDTSSSIKGSVAGMGSAQMDNIIKATKEGVDALSTLTTMAQSDALKVILARPDMQKKIVESMPLLGALKGFDKIANSNKLQGADVTAAFSEGLGTALEFVGQAVSKVKDPAATSAKTAVDVAKSNPALFASARSGDKDALYQINQLINDKEHPGLNTTAFREIAKKKSPRLLDVLSMDGVGEVVGGYVDGDVVMKSIARHPINTKTLIDKITGQP